MARTPELGYLRAYKILEVQYGQYHSIVTAQVKRLIEGPLLKQNDHVILTQLEHDVGNCKTCCLTLRFLIHNPASIACLFKSLHVIFKTSVYLRLIHS